MTQKQNAAMLKILNFFLYKDNLFLPLAPWQFGISQCPNQYPEGSPKHYSMLQTGAVCWEYIPPELEVTTKVDSECGTDTHRWVAQTRPGAVHYLLSAGGTAVGIFPWLTKNIPACLNRCLHFPTWFIVSLHNVVFHRCENIYRPNRAGTQTHLSCWVPAQKVW